MYCASIYAHSDRIYTYIFLDISSCHLPVARLLLLRGPRICACFVFWLCCFFSGAAWLCPIFWLCTCFSGSAVPPSVSVSLFVPFSAALGPQFLCRGVRGLAPLLVRPRRTIVSVNIPLQQKQGSLMTDVISFTTSCTMCYILLYLIFP